VNNLLGSKDTVSILNDLNKGFRKWDNVSAGRSPNNSSVVFINGSFGTSVITKTSAYTATYDDQIILVDSTSAIVTITLPTAVGITGRRYTIKDWKGTSATNNITVATTSSQKIDGASTQVFATNYQAIEVASDGSNWSIISNK
jgi:hypothetical protein